MCFPSGPPIWKINGIVGSLQPTFVKSFRWPIQVKECSTNFEDWKRSLFSQEGTAIGCQSCLQRCVSWKKLEWFGSHASRRNRVGFRRSLRGSVGENFAEDRRSASEKDSDVALNRLLVQSLKVLDDSGIQFQTENNPSDLIAMWEWAELTIGVKDFLVDHLVENLTFRDNTKDLETSKPVNKKWNLFELSGRKKSGTSRLWSKEGAMLASMESCCYWKEWWRWWGEGVLLGGLEAVTGRKSCPGSSCSERTLTDSSLHKMKAMAGAKIGEMVLCSLFLPAMRLFVYRHWVYHLCSIIWMLLAQNITPVTLQMFILWTQFSW